LSPRIWSTPLALEDAFFVDAGTTYDGAATTTIDRLWHHEGTYVEGLADGAAVAETFVQNGQITLGAEASKVHIGKAYTSDLRTLPASMSNMEAFGRPDEKTVTSVSILVKDSSGVATGQTFDDLFVDADRTVPLIMGDPPPMFTGMLDIPVGLGWANGGEVCVRQNRPLPCTVLAIAPSLEFGG
jgi:hypothetical protein